MTLYCIVLGLQGYKKQANHRIINQFMHQFNKLTLQSSYFNPESQQDFWMVCVWVDGCSLTHHLWHRRSSLPVTCMTCLRKLFTQYSLRLSLGSQMIVHMVDWVKYNGNSLVNVIGWRKRKGGHVHLWYGCEHSNPQSQINIQCPLKPTHRVMIPIGDGINTTRRRRTQRLEQL